MIIGIINIQSEEKTKFIAEELYKICITGDLIALYGELGSGKSTFAKYFIKKATNIKSVPSPTYNLILPYKTKLSTIYHMDAWRINDENEAASLGITEMFESSIFIIEWADKIKSFIPENCLNLIINTNDNIRELIFKGNTNWHNRLKKFSFNE